MPLFPKPYLTSTALAALLASPAFAADADADAANDTRNDIVVMGTLGQENASATGLPLTVRETPQSVTIIGRARIDDFALTNVNDLLTQIIGINVERVETAPIIIRAGSM
jgi:outer-membrane receptor for ferric coprogen and ferric-rhodotorulic acid